MGAGGIGKDTIVVPGVASLHDTVDGPVMRPTSLTPTASRGVKAAQLGVALGPAVKKPSWTHSSSGSVDPVHGACWHHSTFRPMEQRQHHNRPIVVGPPRTNRDPHFRPAIVSAPARAGDPTPTPPAECRSFRSNTLLWIAQQFRDRSGLVNQIVKMATRGRCDVTAHPYA